MKKPNVSRRAKVALAGFVSAMPVWLMFKIWEERFYEDTVISYEQGLTEFLHGVELALHLVTAFVAFLSAMIYKPTWKLGIASALTGALMFRVVDIWIYSLGSIRWVEYRGFFMPLMSAITLGALVGSIVVLPKMLDARSRKRTSSIS